MSSLWFRVSLKSNLGVQASTHRPLWMFQSIFLGLNIFPVLGISLSTVSELLKLGTLSDQIQEKILEINIRGREYFRRLLSFSMNRRNI